MHRAGGGVRDVVELGAGFGRTAHTMLAVFPSIERYRIVDLPETLSLSVNYLREVLPNPLMEKIEFIEAGDIDKVEWQTGGRDTPDLAIQIDGLQEMEKTTIDSYYRNIFDKTNFVFLSNPIGKYCPGVAGISQATSQAVEQVMDLGRCNFLIDPWNSMDLERARPKYLTRYQPESHRLVFDQPSRLRSFYQHVLYERR